MPGSPSTVPGAAASLPMPVAAPSDSSSGILMDTEATKASLLSMDPPDTFAAISRLAPVAAAQNNAPLLSHLLSLHVPSAPAVYQIIEEITTPEICTVVLAAGINITIPPSGSSYDETLLSTAISDDNHALVNFLLDPASHSGFGSLKTTGEFENAFPLVCAASSPAMVATLLTHSGDGDANDLLKGTMWLHHAAMHPAPLPVLTALLDAGADPNENLSPANYHRHNNSVYVGTPLHFAVAYTPKDPHAEAHAVRVVTILLNYGADPRLHDCHGQSVLSVARTGKGMPDGFCREAWPELETVLAQCKGT